MGRRTLFVALALLAAAALFISREAWRDLIWPPALAAFDQALIDQPLPAAADEPALWIVGSAKTNAIFPGDAFIESAPAAAFSLDTLESLPQTQITTTTDWTEGEFTVSGPLLRDVIALAGGADPAGGFQAYAVNNYNVEIPVEDMLRYDVALATRFNGERLDPRDKGPLWITYPTDRHPRLRNDGDIKARWIWQLIALTVK